MVWNNECCPIGLRLVMTGGLAWGQNDGLVTAHLGWFEAPQWPSSNFMPWTQFAFGVALLNTSTCVTFTILLRSGKINFALGSTGLEKHGEDVKFEWFWASDYFCIAFFASDVNCQLFCHIDFVGKRASPQDWDQLSTPECPNCTPQHCLGGDFHFPR